MDVGAAGKMDEDEMDANSNLDAADLQDAKWLDL
jgi:hypothetical protein